MPKPPVRPNQLGDGFGGVSLGQPAAPLARCTAAAALDSLPRDANRRRHRLMIGPQSPLRLPGLPLLRSPPILKPPVAPAPPQSGRGPRPGR
jgi:hypothetical protein